MGPASDPVKELGPGKYNPSKLETKRTFAIKDDLKGRFGKTEAKEKEVETREEEPTRVNSWSKKGSGHKSVFRSKDKRYEFGEI